MKRKRRILSLLLSGAMLFSLCSQPALAEGNRQADGVTIGAGGLCEHHPEHDSDCGYTEGSEGTPCVHEHTADCYEEVTNCVHEHDEDCYPEESVSGNEATPSGAQKREPENCPHICDEKSGCITKELNCQHEHDDECGYSPATAGTPCGYVCELCGAGDNTPSNAKAVTVASVQAMIDALPNAEEITEDNAEDVKAQLDAIDEAKEKLSDEEIDELDFTRYAEAAAALGALAAPMLLADDSPDEQFSLKPGDTYYFDLSAMGIPGTANSGNSDGAAPLPDMSLHYVPFTYVGTINAYSRNSEGVSTDDTVKPYAHSLFVADYNVTHTVSWDDLNTASLIFGKNCAVGGVDYTLRAPSVGSGSTGSDDSQRGTPQSNEWDMMLNKNSEYIQNWNKMSSWGQDAFPYIASYRAVRGYASARRWSNYNATYSNPRVGFRPVLEVLNPDTLGSDGLKVVTLDLGGGTLGGSSDAIQIIVKNGSTFTAPASDSLTRPDGDTGSYFMWLGSDGKLYAPGDNVPADVTKLTAQFALPEQFSLTPGGRYYFDLSGASIPGTVNTGNEDGAVSLPDTSLHYVPFTYVGAINAYSRNSEDVSTDDTVKPYAHSLFVADYNVTHTVSWGDLNTASLIFGKNYASGGVNYTLRAPSVGSASTGSDDSKRGTPQSNEWDTMLNKNSGYIQNWNRILSWGQDACSTSYRAFRGYISARFWNYDTATYSNPIVGFRPVLEVPNPDTLGSDGLEVVTLDLGGGKLGNSSDAIQIIVKNGSEFTAPASGGLNRPDGNTGNFFMWRGSNDKLYAPGESVPADVTALTVQWTVPTYTVTLNTNGGTIADGKDVTGYTYGVGATLPTDVTRTGYTFKGWYDNENLTGSPVTAISNTETGNKEYWAKWTVNQYTITYDLAGGTVEGNPDTYTIETEAFTLKNPTKSGYTFTGWSGTGLDGENNMTVTIPTGSTGNRTYTAHWRYNGSGSSSSGGGSSSSEDRDDPSGNAFITDRPNKDNPNTPTTGQTTPVKPTTNGNANINKSTIQQAIDKAAADAKKNGNTANGIAVVVPVNVGDTRKDVQITLKADTLDKLASSNVKRFTIDTDCMADFDFTLDTLKELNRQTGGELILKIKKTVVSYQEAKKAIGSRPVYDITLECVKDGKKTAVNLNGETISVAIPYTPAKNEKTGNLYAVYVDKTGKVEWLTKSSYDADQKAVIFEAAHFSIYGVGYKNPVPNFTDINGHWAKEHILFTVSRGLFSGTGKTTFSPNTTLTRGMFVTALGRLAGINPADYKNGKFTDVKTDAYYAPYVNWAASKGIVNGTGATTFAPDNKITREQMAVIMKNYADKMGYSIPKTLEAVTFADNAQISSWAKDAVKAMQQAGVLSGKANNLFDPKGNATRAEAATVLHRFVEVIIDPQTANSWQQNDSGEWSYYKDGEPVKGWLSDDQKWYWLDKATGKMFSGGWKQIDGKWYYFYADGSMAVSTKVDGYEVGADGARR